MSEPKRISPLLDGFAIGSAMNEHNGICCCPAIKENTEEKYIVKIISVPASQAQLDAFILAGAYKDAEAAMPYFQGIAEDILKEAQFLKDLSRIDGFLSYESWQMEPITKHRVGYEVYLLGDYRRSLEKHVRKKPATHLEAMNMALDICTALSVCRQAGSIYVDLKPSNIFLTEQKAFKIGDLGFIRLKELKYSALPQKYISSYSPPELLDPMESVNLSVDTYALGMILYQLYNEGNFPRQPENDEDSLQAPVNADYELAEIILKAIHKDPAQRWQDPGHMGQALVAYMQRNQVNDVPITPYTPIDTDAQNVQIDREELPQNPVSQDTTVFPVLKNPNETEENTSEEVSSVENSQEPSDGSRNADAEEVPAESEEAPAAEADPENPDFPGEPSACEENSEPELQETAITEEPVAAEESPAVAEVEALSPPEQPVMDEMASIFAKVEDLIAHDTPTGVLVPELPEQPDPFAFATEDSIEKADLDTPFDPVMETPEDKRAAKTKKNAKKRFLSPKHKRRIRNFFLTLLLLFALAAAGTMGYWYYQNIYIQTVEGIHIEGGRDQITVHLRSDAEDGVLTVSCSDNYGNIQKATAQNGQAQFSNLLPNTMYTVSVSVEGFHSLQGHTSEVFVTDTTTNVLSFTAVTGPDDGSVVLDFSVDGDEPEKWVIRYSCEEEEVQTVEFSGHTITVDNLAIGKLYTFTLEAAGELSLSGQTALSFIPSRLILAENLTVSTSNGRDLTIRWNAPGDTVVESWNVRCYNDSDYDNTVTVQDTQVNLTDIDPQKSYVVEVTAAGMTQPARASITANPIIITALNVDDSAPDKLVVSWEYSGQEPEGGWLLMYRIDGNVNVNVIKCSKASAQISPKLPDADYSFTVQAVDATSIFDNTLEYTCPSAAGYNANGITSDQITAHLLVTPEDDQWNFDRIGSNAFTDQFKLGEPISIVLHGTTDFYLPGTNIQMLYVIRDAHGNVIPDYVSEADENWRQIWQTGNYHYGELDLPVIPEAAGSYQLSIYIDGTFVAQTSFTVSE